MIKILLIGLLLIVGCGGDIIKLDINNLIDRGGLMYAPNDEKPYSGPVFALYENGQKSVESTTKDGKG